MWVVQLNQLNYVSPLEQSHYPKDFLPGGGVGQELHLSPFLIHSTSMRAITLYEKDGCTPHYTRILCARTVRKARRVSVLVGRLNNSHAGPLRITQVWGQVPTRPASSMIQSIVCDRKVLTAKSKGQAHDRAFLRCDQRISIRENFTKLRKKTKKKNVYEAST